MEGEENFISGIFNYCDRWCERCDFTERCRVFANERRHDIEDSDDPMGDTLRIVSESLAEAKQMLYEQAEIRGIDLNAAMNDPAVAEGIERADRVVESEEAVKLAKQYAMETRLLLEDPEPWAGDPDEDLAVADTLEVLRYYLFSVAVNVHGCYHAILDTDGYEEPGEISDTQSYANGSAKITLIIIERTILGWTYLLSETNGDLLRPVIGRLEKIRDLLEAKFPNAREFIRPGFDEIEMVM